MNQDDIIQQGMRSAEFMAAQKPAVALGHENQDAELKTLFVDFAAETRKRELELEARIAALEARISEPRLPRRRRGNKQNGSGGGAP